MLALKHFDPIIGIDIHIIQPPGPVPPLPIPHPHIASIFDVMDYLPILGATVKVNGLYAARAGTFGQAAPPHIPMGGMFVKPPTNESVVFMGSATVLADGAPMAFMGVPVLTCQDIGIPAPFRKKKPPATREEAGTTVQFHYDTEERLVGIQNEHGFVYRFELGPTGEVDAETGFDGMRREFKRDSLGQIVEVLRPDERVTKYVYDAAGRVLVAAQPDASSHWFKYRADGELVRTARTAARTPANLAASQSRRIRTSQGSATGSTCTPR